MLSIGLAMDAFAVSVALGLSLRNPRPTQSLAVASLFGGFQAGMPVLGWMAGIAVSRAVSEIDHWIAFTLLSAVGLRMIWESRKTERAAIQSLASSPLLLLSVATSIAAFAAGITLPLMGLPLLPTVVAIWSITFLLSFLGVYLGGRVGHLFEGIVEIGGGAILIVIAFRILLEHLL